MTAATSKQQISKLSRIQSALAMAKNTDTGEVTESSTGKKVNKVPAKDNCTNQPLRSRQMRPHTMLTAHTKKKV